MMKEKTIVCIGIFLILAVLTSCAFYYSNNSYPAERNDMECSGSFISLGVNSKPAPANRYEPAAVAYTSVTVT